MSHPSGAAPIPGTGGTGAAKCQCGGGKGRGSVGSRSAARKSGDLVAVGNCCGINRKHFLSLSRCHHKHHESNLMIPASVSFAFQTQQVPSHLTTAPTLLFIPSTFSSTKTQRQSQLCFAALGALGERLLFCGAPSQIVASSPQQREREKTTVIAQRLVWERSLRV